MAYKSKKAAVEAQANWDFSDAMNRHLMENGHHPLSLAVAMAKRAVGYNPLEAAESILNRDY